MLRVVRGNRRRRGNPLCAHLTAVNGLVTKFFRDAEELVVLRHPVGPAKRTGLDLAGVGCDRDVGNGRVFRFAGAMTDHGGVFVLGGETNGIERFGERADLIHLHKNGICHALVDSLFQEFDIGHEQIVAD